MSSLPPSSIFSALLVDFIFVAIGGCVCSVLLLLSINGLWSLSTVPPFVVSGTLGRRSTLVSLLFLGLLLLCLLFDGELILGTASVLSTTCRNRLSIELCFGGRPATTSDCGGLGGIGDIDAYLVDGSVPIGSDRLGGGCMAADSSGGTGMAATQTTTNGQHTASTSRRAPRPTRALRCGRLVGMGVGSSRGSTWMGCGWGRRNAA